MKISNKQELLAVIEDGYKRKRISEHKLCQQAGVSLNTVFNMRAEPKRNINLTTANALIQSIDLDLYALSPLEYAEFLAWKHRD